MKPSPVPSSSPIARHFRPFPIACLLLALALNSSAKDVPLAAIVVFDSRTGPGYVQVTGVTLNGKTELRSCDGVPKFDKHSYDVLPRVQLKVAAILERTTDGVLMLSQDGAKPFCVLPNGVKFDKGPELTPAEAADQAVFSGLVTQASMQPVELPPVKAGVQFVFIAAPDTEFAEYLRARRAQSVVLWQNYLKRYPASAHSVQARQDLAAMVARSAESALAEYARGASSDAPQLSLLQQVRNDAAQIEAFGGGHAAADKVLQDLHAQIDVQLEKNRRQLQAYNKAVSEHASGYARLVSAKKHNEKILEVEPDYPPAVALHNEIGAEENKLDSILHNAESLLLAKRYDDALSEVESYRGMAAELPQVANIVETDYKFHFSRGQQLSAQGSWEQATVEFRAASRVRPESVETAAALRNAEAQAGSAFNRRVVEQALADSRSYAQKNDFIAAYDVLANLPEQQRILVVDQLEALKKDYVPAAARRAQKLQEIHLPIRGRADEEAMRQAYELLQRAGAISNDPAAKLKLDLLSDKLGTYYLELGRRYLQKPMGSGVALGWLYLREAQRYEPNLDAVKDETARYQAAYQLRGRLSIGVVVRDQTSRREGQGFADQLGDAIANGLESSSQPVKVIRRYSEDPNAIQPDFVLVGEIIQHRMVKNTNLETLPSKYRAATREVKNEAWLSTSQAFEQAQQELSQAQRALAEAQRRSKKDAATVADNLAAVQKKVDDLRKQMDTLNPTRSEAVLEPYNYTKKAIDLTAVVELAFRLTDQSGNLADPAPPIHREDHKTYIVLENVKPEDTEGVKAMNTPPDEVQFVTDLELQARDALVKAITEKAAHLRKKVLQQARQRLQQQDIDGAATEYIVFLNSTPDNGSPERTEAASFLRDHFNLAVATNTSTTKQAQAR
ncbi:MAG TPA: hypothetical protein VH724_07070 [Candidatus Angelobacter sp.]|nr:hypothetical protein [Candidatus Angelobacter sp.]